MVRKVGRVKTRALPWTSLPKGRVMVGRVSAQNDQDFAMELLETQHVLVAPGSSFNVDYRNYFRITVLPQAKVIDDVFQRIENILEEQ